MTKTANKKREVNMPASIRKKLSAALCMLLISAIMLVSSTYAWFTLSTAPEVTGITTNVGANGNLEIALLDGTSYLNTEEDFGIVSKVGDSMDLGNVKEANKTWGNLVDLSDESYGLGAMMLMPARLNLNGTTVLSSPLLAPSYGSDGRVIDVTTQTILGPYTDAGFTYDTTSAGVRVIGTSSGVTVRISGYRAALSNARASMTNAQTAARASLNNEAQNIATMLVDMVQGKNEFDSSALVTLQNIIDGVTSANDYAALAIKQAALAYTLSKDGPELTDEQVGDLQDAVAAATPETIANVSGIKLPDGLSSAITTYGTNSATLVDAQKALTELKDSGKTTFTADEIGDILDLLVKRENTYVEGYQALGTNKDAIITSITDVENITDVHVDIEMRAGSGVYYNIAEMCGNYTVETTVKVSYGGANVGAPTTMETAAENPYLPISITAIQKAGAPEEGGAGTTVAISDTYGYILDFGFRTNAAGSSLKLQTEATQRVYDDSQATATMGLGSRMAFVSSDPDNFTVDDMKALMSAIRVAFVVPNIAENTTVNDYTLLAMGALDITATTDGATGITTYEGGSAVEGEDNSWQADLVLYDYESADGKITLGDKKTEAVLTSLDQNVAKKVTVIVYLDGDLVDNTMVANANTSMVGKLNLQFSSTASLKPMENSALRNYTEATD